VSRAVRTPTLSEDGIGTRQLPVFPPALGGAPLFPRLMGTPDFASERLIAYELGYRSDINERLSVDLATFYNSYDHLRTIVPGAAIAGSVPGTFDLPLTFQNRMRGEGRGAEVAVTWQLGNEWLINATYSYLKLNLRADATLPASTITSSEAPTRQSPQQQAQLRSSWNVRPDLEFDLTGRFVDQLTVFSPIVPSYVALDARVTWRPRPEVELEIIAQNLLDAAHPELGTAPLLRSLQVDIERGAYGRIRWRF
jgi:iron complex outermembrane receptor protein